MAAAAENELYYQIVIDARGAMTSLRELGDSAGSFEAIIAQAEESMKALAEQFGVDTQVIAGVFKKMNADIAAANRERIQTEEQDAQKATAALEEERQKVIALDAAIQQAARNAKDNPIAPTVVTPDANFLKMAEDAQLVVKALNEMRAAGASNDEMIAMLGANMKRMAEQFDVELPVIVDLFKQMGLAIDIDEATLNRLALRAQQLNIKTEIDAAKKSLDDANVSGISFESTLRMIEGVIVSMAVFQGIQAISQMFTDATKNAMDYYRSLQNITVAQSAMAQQGINVTNQQMLDVANQLHEKWQTISQVDITQAVSQAGLMASEYHLSVEQMTQLANEAAILHSLDPSKPMADYVVQLAKALEGGRSLALNGEQIAITTEELKNKAVELGLVQEGSKAALTDQQKIVAGLAIEYDRLHPEEQKLTEEIKNGTSALVQSEEATAKWKDMSTSVGAVFADIGSKLQVLGTFFAALVLDVVRWEQNIVIAADELVVANEPLKEMGALAYAIGQIFAGNIHSVQDFVKALADGQTVLEKMVEKAAELARIPDWRNLGQSMQDRSGLNFGNTPIGPAPDVTGANSIDESKLQSILDSLAKDYQQYYDSVQKATEEFNARMQDLQDQYNLNVQKTIEDYDLRVTQEKQNYRLKELQQEQDFQQKMKELQDRYLLDLEDALRKRDAEAVIKLIERYNMEKDQAQEQEKLKQQQDKQAEQLKLQQMKQEEELRLKQLKEEYDLQQKEAERAYQLQLQQLTQALDQKLQEEAVKAQQDLGLNQDSINAIYKLFQDYYGPNGKFAQEQQSSYTMMIQQSQGFIAQMLALFAQYFSALGNIGTGFQPGDNWWKVPNLNPPPTPVPPPDRRKAEGGMVLAGIGNEFETGVGSVKGTTTPRMSEGGMLLGAKPEVVQSASTEALHRMAEGGMLLAAQPSDSESIRMAAGGIVLGAKPSREDSIQRMAYGGAVLAARDESVSTPTSRVRERLMMAEGGLALAASATEVTFGEAGPELAMFLPLNSAGVPTGGGAGANGLPGLNGAGGFVTIALQLSGDLEARIVDTTLTHAALQIERVYRSH